MNDLSAIPVPPDQADEFFRQQESLHAEHIRSIARARRTAWWVAGCATALAVLESVGIASLAPLHSVEWRLVRVDSSTGAIDVVNQLTDAPKTVTEVNARATMALYVQRREGYVVPEVEYNFRATSLMSAPAEQHRYADAVRGGPTARRWCSARAASYASASRASRSSALDWARCGLPARNRRMAAHRG